MPDITTLLANDDVTVLGPPSVIELLVDIGPTGTRGSQIFVGNGNPNNPLTEIGQTPIFNDLYLNISPGAEYAYMYQYVSEIGGPTWSSILQVNPVIYSTRANITFSSGIGSLTIAVADILNNTGTTLTQNKFNIQYNFINTNPISSSIQIPELVDPDYLIINFKAIEYDSTWSDLSGEVEINLFISVVQ
jgi:hypothetical protein